MKRKASLKSMSSTVFVALILIFSYVAFASATAVWTDKPDYSPGETVLISGDGFNPGEEVSVDITRPDGLDSCPVAGKCDTLPVADGSGSFSNYPYSLNGVVGSYTVDAYDAVNSAQTIFTDGTGTIWTRRGGCGGPQDENQYGPGEEVWIEGSGFAVSTQFTWDITGQPSSCDPSTVVATDTVTSDSNGDFCLYAYTVQEDDCKGYKADVNGKQDSYSVVCVDRDGDGYDTYSVGCSNGNDCDDDNADVNPGATEICNNIDDDCDGEIDEGGVCPTCADAKALGLLTGSITGNTGSITNTADGSYNVGLAVYKKTNEIIDDQMLFDYDLGNVGPSNSLGLEVTLPDCAYQIDLFCGELIEEFDTGTGVIYNGRLLANAHTYDYCSEVCTTDEDCDDGVSCTEDTCVDESCVYTPNDGNCDDGLVCNGEETCDAQLGCVQGNPVVCDGSCSAIGQCDGIRWNYRPAWQSECTEPAGVCTSSLCDIVEYCSTDCDAECENDQDCNSGTCNLDTCSCEETPQEICGDGILDAGEECDDGNTDDGDGCSANCMIEETTTIPECQTDIGCDDSNACTDDACVAGICVNSPVTCDDGVSCTVDTCDAQNGCVYTPDDGLCDNGLWCDGSEVCDLQLGCMQSTAPCTYYVDECTTVGCDEENDVCTETPVPECCLDDDDCNYLDADYCDIDDLVHEEGVCINTVCEVQETSRTDCYYYNEYCSATERWYDQGYCDDAVPQCDSTSGMIEDCSLNNFDACYDAYSIQHYTETCQDDQGTTQCLPASSLSDCRDDLYCNGEEVCSEGGGVHCEDSAPVDCSYLNDECHEGVCDEKNDQCEVMVVDDITGPVTSNLMVDPFKNNGIFDITAVATDTCSNIEESEYFIGHISNAGCGTPGTGTPMDAFDGNFDSLVEDVKKDNVNYFVDGLNWVCVHSKDAAQNWGNCVCYWFETDDIPPTCTYDITLDGVPHANELLICDDSPRLTAEVCDDQSPIQGGEYFFDLVTPPIPAPWTGYWMSVDHPYERNGLQCAQINATMNTTDLEDGTHSVRMRGKDILENWGKIHECDDVTFIVDRIAPKTEKELLPFDDINITCDITEAKGETITNGCAYVKQGTEIVLDANDFNPDDDTNEGYNDLPGEYANNVVTYYNVYWSYDCETDWVLDQYGSGAINETVTITLTKDSCHLIEYWSVDACGYAEEKHYELDIVDTQSPEIVKSIEGPSYGDCLPESPDDICFIDGVTQIHVTADDPQPHPVNDVTCDWDYTVTGGDKIGEGGTDVTAPFDINFPEESSHELTITCRDALGNVATDIETFLVDKTKPTTTKEYGTPYVSADGKEWITSDTLITLTVDDTGPHKSGIKKTGYRVTQVDDEYCFGEWDCQQVDGSGDWNDYSDSFTIGEESCHVIEYYSVDNVEKTEEVKKQCVFVENTAPVIGKDISEPKHECTKDEWLYYNSILGDNYPDYGCHYITQDTSITLDCIDEGDHPVNEVTLYWRDYLLNAPIPDWTVVPGGRDVIQKNEDSEHILEFYCEDALGNADGIHKEIDIVDTQEPVSEKTLGDPKHACEAWEQELYYPGMPDPTDGCSFITQQTPITLTCTDGEPHPVDHVKLYYRDWIIREPEHCVGTPQLPCEIIGFEFGMEKCMETEGCFWDIDLCVGIPDLEACLPYTYEQCVEIPGCDWIAPDVPDYTEVDGDEVTIYKEEDSAHILEWYCVDALGNVEDTHVEYDIVDTQAPETTKDIIGPQYLDIEFITSFIDGVTVIELTCVDPEPHPVDHEVIKYRYRVDEGLGYGDWTEWIIYTDVFGFPEESKHELEYYCVDALGNEETHKFEVDYVDHTPPVTTKTYDTPLVEAVTGGYPKWITSQTPITLTADDGNANHASGVANTQYRVRVLNNPANWHYCYDGCEGWNGILDQLEMNVPTPWMLYESPFTIGEESCHVIEYYSVDNVEKTEEVKRQCVFVEDTPPVSEKTLGDPKHACEAWEQELYYPGMPDPTDGCSFITQQTPITLTCTDGEPHPVDHVKLYYRDWIIGRDVPDYTEVDGDEVTIYKEEDSAHILEWYCVDALGNVEDTHVEYDIVDTQAPADIKIIGEPKIPCEPGEECDYWVRNHVTPITLDCVDPEPHPVDHEIMCYRMSFDIEPWLTQQYCLEFGGYLTSVDDDAWCCVDVSEEPYTFTFQEDSLHDLEFYCEDALGNRKDHETEYFRVDSTPPNSQKTIEGPTYPEDLDLNGEIEGEAEETFWVTSDTLFTLTGTDEAEPCDVGVCSFHVVIEWDSDCDGNVDDLLLNNYVPAPYDYTFRLSDFAHALDSNECLHKITWSAVDCLGNEEEPKTQYHKLDDTPPHILILKPVDGWYSAGEDIPVVAVAEDLTNPHGACGLFDQDPWWCAVGIEDGDLCEVYFIDLLPEFDIIDLESHVYYNANAHECQGYVTVPEGVTDGIVILGLSVDDNLGNEGDSIMEIYHSLMMNCGCEFDDGMITLDGPGLCLPSCISDAIQDIVTIWNLPKIGIDNTPPEVEITEPSDEDDGIPTITEAITDDIMDVSADVSDGEPGDVTSGITSGTPCYVTIDGVSVGTMPYFSSTDECSGSFLIPDAFEDGEYTLGVCVFDNAGNEGCGYEEILLQRDFEPPEFLITDGPYHEILSHESVSVTWTTNLLSDSWVKYGMVNEWCEGTPSTDACDPYDQEQCDGITGCNWEQDFNRVCSGEPTTCENYNNEQCGFIDGCVLTHLDYNYACTGIPNPESCSPYTQAQCDAITGCTWQISDSGYCTGCGFITDDIECSLTKYCHWDADHCYDISGLSTCYDITDSVQCGDEECQWVSGDDNSYCYGKPSSCAGVATEWPNDPAVKCDETSGCLWEQVPVGDPICTGVPSVTCDEIQSLGIDYGYDDKCTETPGCNWEDVLITEGCEGTPEVSCEWLGQEWGEDKCLETAGCDWIWDCDYTQGQHTWDLLTEHPILLTGLYPDTEYCYKVRSEDEYGQIVETQTNEEFGRLNFTTPKGEEAPESDADIVIPSSGWWNIGWNTFFLPRLILEDVLGGGGDFSTVNVMSSVAGNYEMLYYYNGADWDSYVPGRPINDLTVFNDQISNPYFVKMTAQDRLELYGP